MNIRDAKTEVIHTIRAYTVQNKWGGYAIPALRQRPLLLIGPPGIGKTAIMEQAASECGIGFVSYTMTHHTRQSAIGLPFIERTTFHDQEYAVTHYTMSEIIASVFQCIEESGCKEGLLFLDEINCVSETLAPTMLQFLQNKTFGTHRLPDGWILAAAGNPPEYNKSVREFDIATLDRLKYIEVEADYEAWRSYALEKNLHAAILSYLDAHRDRFYLLKQTYTETAFVTARGWEDLSCLLDQYELLGFPVTAELIAQYLHSEELAADFAGYYQFFMTRKKELPLTAMMQGDQKAFSICQELFTNTSFDEKLNLTYLMLSAIGNDLQEWKKASDQILCLQNLFEKWQRFLKQQKLTKASPSAVSEFLKKEQEILRIRKEHGLSSDHELEEMQHALYELRTILYQEQQDPFPSCYETQLSASAGQLSLHLENSIRLLSKDNGSAYTLFLSSLEQNKNLQLFLRKYPSKLWESARKQLAFQTREEKLRQQLLSSDSQPVV